MPSRLADHFRTLSRSRPRRSGAQRREIDLGDQLALAVAGAQLDAIQSVSLEARSLRSGSRMGPSCSDCSGVLGGAEDRLLPLEQQHPKIVELLGEKDMYSSSSEGLRSLRSSARRALARMSISSFGTEDHSRTPTVWLPDIKAPPRARLPEVLPASFPVGLAGPIVFSQGRIPHKRQSGPRCPCMIKPALTTPAGGKISLLRTTRLTKSQRAS